MKTDEATLVEYGKDWSKIRPPAPSGIVFPSSTDEVSRFLKLCFEHNQKVVPSGGRTGLSGGALAADGEWVLSLERMNRIGDVDLAAMQIKVQAGAITEAVRNECQAKGVTWPIHFGAIGSSQIGGNIATNAGGHQVLKYGSVRNWVVSLTSVLADGTVLNLDSGLEKSNTGLDLKQLFIGSEGTLGIVTEATLKLVVLSDRRSVVWVGVDSVSDALSILGNLRESRKILDAAELMDRSCVDAVVEHFKMKNPLSEECPYSFLLSVECEVDELEPLVLLWSENGWMKDGVVATTSEQTESLWKIRESIGEVLASKGRLHKNDISLPQGEIANFVERFRDEVASEEIPVFVFGHLGDGNLHLNTLMPGDMKAETFEGKLPELDQKTFQIISDLKGSISAEHGIGLLKRKGLKKALASQEIELMQKIKKVMDPSGILNPGKIYF